MILDDAVQVITIAGSIVNLLRRTALGNIEIWKNIFMYYLSLVILNFNPVMKYACVYT